MSSQPVKETVEERGIDTVEVLLKASADRLRLGVLQVLEHDSYGVLELCNLFEVKQSAMSHHLKVLASAGLVTTRREGNAIFYRRALPLATNDSALVEQLFAAIDARPISERVQSAIEKAQLHRSESSKQFFADHSERFEAQQDLIAPINEYRDTLNEVIDSLLQVDHSPVATKQAIEIGPGEGNYLGDLAERFEHLIALDNSEAMLDRCRRTASRKKLSNIGFIHGDTSDLLELASQLESGTTVTARRANCIVANMVLHHNARPQTIFEHVKGLLAANGVFVVSELCQHDQDWVREAAGDVWLGFGENQLASWSQRAGLQKQVSSYTALRNGFRIQIHAYSNPALAGD